MTYTVAHIITEAHYLGGAQRNTLLTMLPMAARIPSTLIAGNDGPMLTAATEGNIETMVVPMTNRWLTPASDLVALWQLYIRLRRGKYHVVHTHSTKAGILGRVAARLAGVPVIVHTIHGTPFQADLSWPATKVAVLSEKVAALCCDRIVAVAEQLKDYFVQLGVCSSSKIEVIYSGIDFSVFDAPTSDDPIRQELGVGPNTKIIGSLGSLIPRKGYQYLIEAASHIVAERDDVVFVIVGDGELRSSLEAMIAARNVQGRVRLLGQREDVPRLLRAFDIYVQPSLWEGLGRALTEAMYSGLPVVASNINAIPELVEDHQCGLLVPSADPSAIATALLSLLDKPDFAQMLGRNAREKVIPMMGVDRMVQAIEELYIRLLREKNLYTPSETLA